jgi:hypothetical protein
MLFYLHVICALCALIVGCLAAWGGLALIVAARTHGNVRLPFGFRRSRHVTFGVSFLALLLVTLTLGFIMASGSKGDNSLTDTHQVFGIVVVTLFALGASIGLAMVRLRGKKPTLRMLHLVFNSSGCVLFVVQVVLGVLIVSRLR